jgi:predicted lipoprotein with Yx(FWY)xxD motif
MIRIRPTYLMSVGTLLLAGLLFGGCGDGGSTASKTAMVKVVAMPEHRHVIVDSHGMTLYEFRRDDPMLYEFAREPSPSCYEVCAMTWPPLLTGGPPVAVGGAEASMLGVITRKDGNRQVTYDGHPLYLFDKDARPGETNGQDAAFHGARWHAVEPDGDAYVGTDRPSE